MKCQCWAARDILLGVVLARRHGPPPVPTTDRPPGGDPAASPRLPRNRSARGAANTGGSSRVSVGSRAATCRPRAGSGRSGVDGVDAAAILRRCRRQICRAGGGGRVLAWLAPPTSPTRPKSSSPRNRSVFLVDLASLAASQEPKSSRRISMATTRRNDRPVRGFESQQPWRSSRLDLDRDDPRIHEETHTGTFGAAVERRHRRSRTPGQSTIAHALLRRVGRPVADVVVAALSGSPLDADGQTPPRRRVPNHLCAAWRLTPRRSATSSRDAPAARALATRSVARSVAKPSTMAMSSTSSRGSRSALIRATAWSRATRSSATRFFGTDLECMSTSS